ncbi:MAG TPA: YbhB/YbcL family Raf kinase inhibitor-like protein [Polyangiaceae bacterium]|nr:YbhB/YbcL family Raf kinase inhibitor-like protein [Polyangiaceae bacterium]
MQLNRVRSASTLFGRGPLLLAAGVQFIALASCSDNGGGTATTGGAPASTGGNPTGGVVATGGTGTGGVATGGVPSTGGVTATGGTVATGGSATGGTPASTGGTNAGASGTTGGSGGASGANTSGGVGGSNGGGSNGGAGGSSAGTGGAKGGASSTGGTNGGTNGGGGSGSGGGASGFTLTSPNHAEGATFAAKYTCSEKGFSGSIMPELHWTAGPAGTKSYAITFIDTTLARKMPVDTKGFHWVIYNIPATVTSLPEAMTDAQAKALPAKENSAFLGPCPNYGTAPPTGSKTDNYEFTLYALATETVDITGSNIVQAADTKLEGMNLAKTKLTGKSNAANTR